LIIHITDGDKSKLKFEFFRVAYTNVYQNLIADQQNFRAKYLQIDEEN